MDAMWPPARMRAWQRHGSHYRENPGRADQLIRRRFEEIEVPHLIIAVTPDGQVALRTSVSPDVRFPTLSIRGAGASVGSDPTLCVPVVCNSELRHARESAKLYYRWHQSPPERQRPREPEMRSRSPLYGASHEIS